MCEKKPRNAVDGRDVAAPSRPAELSPEDVERHQAEPEDRRRDPEQGEAHRHSVGGRSAFHRRQDADRHPEHEPDDGGACDQEERAWRPRDDQRLHGRLARVRVAEAGPAVLVAEEEVLGEVVKLHVPRMVEAEPLVDQVELLRGRVLARKPQCGVARRQEVEDREGDREHTRDDDDCPDEPACDVEHHCGLLELREGAGEPAPSVCLRRYCFTETDEYAGPSVNWS